MHPSFDSEHTGGGGVLESRIESLAAWIGEVETRVRTTELATADEATARELRRALEIVASHDPEIERRLTDRVNVIAERLETLSAALATTASALAAKDGEIAKLQRRLDEESSRVDALAIGRPADAAVDGDVRRAIAELAARVEAISEGDAARRHAVDELTARFRSSDEHLGSLADDPQRRLETLTADTQETADDRLAALDERLSALEQSATDAQLEGLRMRLASAERELAELSGSQRVVDRIDDVARRLSELDRGVEQSRISFAPRVEASGPGTELRSLEVRMERAEAAERETRLEFLSHLERLAERIEQRLGELDDRGEIADAMPEVVGGARVLPLHDPER